MTVPLEKIKYLKNDTIFFEMACVESHQTLASTTYIKTSEIGDHRLSRVGRDIYGMAHIYYRSMTGYLLMVLRMPFHLLFYKYSHTQFEGQDPVGYWRIVKSAR